MIHSTHSTYLSLLATQTTDELSEAYSHAVYLSSPHSSWSDFKLYRLQSGSFVFNYIMNIHSSLVITHDLSTFL